MHFRYCDILQLLRKAIVSEGHAVLAGIAPEFGRYGTMLARK
jgi:hypothetical protein